MVKLAFSTVACPDWTLEEVARRAQEMGYQGVELRTLGAGATGLACDPALSEPSKIREIFRSAGVEIACLSTSLVLHHKDESDARAAVWQACEYAQMAADLGCPAIRVFGNEVRPGDSRQATLQRIADRALQIADKAAPLGVQVLLENGGSFNKAKEWWWMLNLIDHPMVGMVWNAANGAANGEPVSVAVPVLNSRIRLAKVKDTLIGQGSGFVPLGEGNVGIEQFVKRLLGIGFQGYITAEWDRVWLPSLTPAEEYLPDAHKRLKGWIDAIAQAIEDAKPKPKAAKPAAAKAAAAS